MRRVGTAVVAAVEAAAAADVWHWRWRPWLWPWVRASEEGQVPLRDLVLRGGVEQAVAHEVKGAHTAGVHHLGRGDDRVTWGRSMHSRHWSEGSAR